MKVIIVLLGLHLPAQLILILPYSMMIMSVKLEESVPRDISVHLDHPSQFLALQECFVIVKVLVNLVGHVHLATTVHWVLIMLNFSLVPLVIIVPKDHLTSSTALPALSQVHSLTLKYQTVILAHLVSIVMSMA